HNRLRHLTKEVVLKPPKGRMPKCCVGNAECVACRKFLCACVPVHSCACLARRCRTAPLWFCARRRKIAVGTETHIAYRAYSRLKFACKERCDGLRVRHAPIGSM